MRAFFSSNAMFSPAWWLILVASLALSALTLRLGFWQLGRAQYKESLHAQQVAQRNSAVERAPQV